ncbi:hypothetical protein Paz_06 [Xylella phage Paz]|uniref:Uncharacterized protein n=1 Tax=Xylella phage Paz TaxID=1415145 RepID=V5Q7N5_9CAUD|nr:hypothetical protein Paz_06 [Xylella phage Paz]AHB12103.1 hypothetical protein Paz_06 [Xylella phage Paz]
MKNYPIQSYAAEIQALAERVVSSAGSATLHERQGRNCGGPSGVVHSNVRLRKVLERTHVKTGEVTRFVYDPDVKVEHWIGNTLVTSDENIFDPEHYRRSVFHVFTLTEEEYDREQYHREP